ncbi:hypothetical protein QQZ08_012081 [Neonectria magnoliae]|uniref:Ribosomal protein S21 n=1 Tax=Neonectria magnoliae TaxID=2732573 RepID=A0ABR1H546_9HYPO
MQDTDRQLPSEEKKKESSGTVTNGKSEPRPYRTNVDPGHGDFSASAAHPPWSVVQASVVDDDNFSSANLQLGAHRGSSSRDMPTTPRFGSTMLSRLSTTPTMRAASSRAFTTSIALRSGPSYSRDSIAPTAAARTNPLVGNAPRREPQQESPAWTRTPQARTPRSFNPRPSQPEARSDLPPPPSVPGSLLSGEPAKSNEQHPYTASKTATPFNLDIASIIANKAIAFGEGIESNPMTRPRIRAKAVTGRTVFVRDRITPTSAPTPMIALRVLNKMVREQQVKTKFHSQKFHERNGLKKKRLRSQRWRSRFKNGFKETVNRVLELKRQGW